MFEKSLVDLIKGLRSHKGSETAYIETAMRECRAEIRSQDMDVKATALLKLVYLEMFGYDMTWAAFNVLEVMACAKPLQKRVGYLAAVQTFRPETEVLMLAENLLKKDLTSPSIPVLSLPLVAVPHIVTAELALSVLTELLPRLSHSQPQVRKKTVVALYRLALVYPETLKVSWPKIKERLLDEAESSNVTAAAVNVVCELGWRNPRDFLNLAPRLFELLTSDKNNWMAIKIIKLFAVLTPLEPRLVKKLVRPLTKILRETSAMSLLYECISGIIQGGILDGEEMGVDVDEVADMCISKLRGMIILDTDPNLKYVALLAFNKIVGSHPRLVSEQQDVILACLDDPDISIKMQALELVSGMVDADNLQSVVNRLMKQLANAPKGSPNGDANGHEEPDTDLEQRLVQDKRSKEQAPIPDEYRHDIITRILDMCSSNTYANITDFEWYLDILVHLVRHLPPDPDTKNERSRRESVSLGARIGSQILDIAVRVKELRPEAARSAETLVLVSNRSIVFASHGGGQSHVIKSAAWICGEHPAHLVSPQEVLNSLIHPSTSSLAAETIAVICQAVPKVTAHIWSAASLDWSTSQATTLSLLLARTTTFLETLSSHPNLDVQERAVAFLELLKLCAEALSSHPSDADTAPALLSTVVPALFSGQELNPVSAAAQSKVPIPTDLDLDQAINPELSTILSASQVEDNTDTVNLSSSDAAGCNVDLSLVVRETAAGRVRAVSYQSAPESPATVARRRAERAARARNDPYYIGPSGTNTPQDNGNNDDLDIDAIPIMDLKLDAPLSSSLPSSENKRQSATTKRKQPRKFAIAADETLDDDPSQPTSTSTPHSRSASASRISTAGLTRPGSHGPGRSLLGISSSQLANLSLSGTSDDYGNRPLTAEDLLRRDAEEREMAAALAEVEKKRLELARDQERAGVSYADGVEGTTVVKKRRKKAKAAEVGEDAEGEAVVKKKKKKKPNAVEEEGEIAPEGAGTVEAGDNDDERASEGVVKKKKKAKRRVGGASKEGDSTAAALDNDANESTGLGDEPASHLR
ncbi:AP-3 complex subunit delta-1 [Cyphellophora attinorum]|uniref:AP-3 complex subunit delta n=1 Tax=Cyphellophora attinorum TaxID=1664694 RepID=A0A0N1HHF1_9EURO|nr:AP-3 complex subunit delta-1 [Phialophora attinorum]KPI45404.1 AP-3 complex subunit delta-1 [Phialophora attinorum]